MQIHPLFSVKKAAEALGVEKQFLRNQLEQGMIRGEKRRVGEHDKWFIYNGEVRDLRDTKRLHELLEKAGRISTEDMGDFFDEDDEPANANSVDQIGPVDTTAPFVPAEPAARSRTAKTKTSKANAANYNQAIPGAAKPVLTPESFTEFLDELLKGNQINEDHNAIGLIENQLTTTNKSVTSTDPTDFTTEEQSSEELNVGVVFESQVMDDLSVDDLFFEKVEIVEPDDIDFPEDELVNIDDTVSGSSKITVESMLQKLTAEFAAQLAEERNRVTELTHQLELKEESLKLLPDLESRLEQEQNVRQAHQDEVAVLKTQIASLETERLNANKPWWKKLFG